MGCVSQNSYPRKSIPRQKGKSRSKREVKFSKGTWHTKKIPESKGPSRGIIQKGTSVVLARQTSEKDHMTKPCNKKDAPAEWRGVCRKNITSSRMRTKLRSILLLSNTGAHFKLSRDSGASMHKLSKKVLPGGSAKVQEPRQRW